MNYLQAEADAAGSMLRQIVDLLHRAQAEKTKSQTIVEQFVKYYTPVVLLTALLYGTICAGTDSDGKDDCAKAALVVLILACPCALVAAAPTPVAFGTAAAVRSGAVVKTPQAFEDLADCKTVVFDKTGTCRTNPASMPLEPRACAGHAVARQGLRGHCPDTTCAFVQQRYAD